MQSLIAVAECGDCEEPFSYYERALETITDVRCPRCRQLVIICGEPTSRFVETDDNS